MEAIIFNHDVEDTKEMKKFLADIGALIEHLNKYLTDEKEVG